MTPLVFIPTHKQAASIGFDLIQTQIMKGARLLWINWRTRSSILQIMC